MLSVSYYCVTGWCYFCVCRDSAVTRWCSILSSCSMLLVSDVGGRISKPNPTCVVMSGWHYLTLTTLTTLGLLTVVLYLWFCESASVVEIV